MKLIFWINKLKLNTSSEINVILYRYIWLTQWKSFQKRINGNSFQDNVAISSSKNFLKMDLTFVKTRIYLSTCSNIVDYMLLMISFTKEWSLSHAFFKALQKKVQKKWSYTLNMMTTWITKTDLAIFYPEFWNIFPTLVR